MFFNESKYFKALMIIYSYLSMILAQARIAITNYQCTSCYVSCRMLIAMLFSATISDALHTLCTTQVIRKQDI